MRKRPVVFSLCLWNLLLATAACQTAVAPDRSLYVLSSTERGIEIHYAEAP